jgi:hypothetical protein
VQRATRDAEHHDAVAQRGEQRVEVEVARGVARLLLVDRGHVVAAQEVRHAGQASRPGEIVEEKRWSAIIQPTSSSGGPSAAISRSSAARARVAPRQHSGPFPLRPVRVEPREAALDQRRADASAEISTPPPSSPISAPLEQRPRGVSSSQRYAPTKNTA